MNKKLIMMFGIVSTGFSMYADSLPKADVYLRITGDLPKLGTDARYNGVFSVTNTGEVAFTLITGGEWAFSTIRFYQEGDAERQHNENEPWRGQLQKTEEREEVIASISFCLERGHPSKTLLPGENISFECVNFAFIAHFGTPRGVYKAEMYLGQDTWVPVHITPTLYLPRGVPTQPGKAADFYYTKEGTNQYLYVKMDDCKLKRLGEMKLDSTAVQEKDNTMTFELPDGTKKKLTVTEARQLETKN